jgi:hypothetical protein
MTPGVEWQAGGKWETLAGAAKPKAELKISEQTAGRAAFAVTYAIVGRTVTESYVVSAEGVELTSGMTGAAAGARAILPALVDDGKEPTTVKLDGALGAITLRGSTLKAQVLEPAGVKLALAGDKVACHNGYMRAMEGDLPAGTVAVKWRLTLEQAAK